LDYVLGRPPQAQAGLIHEAVSAAADVIPMMLLEGAEKAMNRLHRRGNTEPPARPA
jgi:peptidyl-tRNA hydrolase